MTVSAPFVLVRSWRALTPTPCQAIRCERLIEPGEDVLLVVHEDRWLRDPDARTAQAFLCSDCTTGLSDRLRDLLPPGEIEAASWAEMLGA